MSPEHQRFPLRFEARVLLPVLFIMGLLLFATLSLVNRRFNQRVSDDSEQALRTAVGVVQKAQDFRGENLRVRSQIWSEEPRFKAVVGVGNRETARFYLLRDVLSNTVPCVIFISKPDGELFTSATLETNINLAELGPRVAASARAALQGKPAIGTLQSGAHLFDIVSVPITQGDVTTGVVTILGDTLGGQAMAEDLKNLTRADVALLSATQVLAATISGPDVNPRLLDFFRGAAPAGRNNPPVSPLALAGKHYWALAGRLTTAGGESDLGYVLLTSFDAYGEELRQTQRDLIMVGVAGMLLSSLVIWFLVRRITWPLRVLREGAETVGRGNFDHRVSITSRDECGALASSFNQMTENLQASRSQLEKTVETLQATREQLLQSEKLSAIGEFVAGVTHELNNPLTGVIGYASLMKQEGVEARHRGYLDNVVSCAQRCHKIVQSLLSFARQHAPERKAVDMNELLENTLAFMQYELRTSNIDLVRQLDPRLPKICADPYQIQQVFLNIINNARHAIGDFRPDGSITIKTEAAGDRVRVTFADNGPGISSANLAKIFNPFFTTKPVGKGTGLGLSVSYGIVQEHGGVIRAESEPGRGAAFIIEIPAMAGNAVAAAPDAAALPAHVARSGQRILAIDDEDMILGLIASGLKRDGCRVDTVASGEEALRMFRENRYHLVICDWKMPGLNGRQIYEQMLAWDPAINRRIIFITGDVINEKIRAFFQEAKVTCLTKPFSVEDLSAVVKRTLEEKN